MRRAGWTIRYSLPDRLGRDTQLSPAIALWLSNTFSVEAFAVRDMQLREAEDKEIFDAARLSNAVVMTKDSDFTLLLDRHGPPPQVIWITCGNTSNARLKAILTALFPRAVQLLEAGEALVEINGP